MSPTVVIVVVLGLGFAILLVAPRLHRRVNARSRAEAQMHRERRIAEMRASPDTTEVTVASDALAVRARDTLLLRGVRAEIATTDAGSVVLVVEKRDAAVVDAVISDLADG